MLISLSEAIEPVGGHTTESVTHGPPTGRYQFILLGEQRHMCVNNLPRVVREAERPGLEPVTSRLQV